MRKELKSYLSLVRKKIPKFAKKMKQGCTEEAIQISENNTQCEYPESYKDLVRKYNGEQETIMMMAGFQFWSIEEALGQYQSIKNNGKHELEESEVFRPELNRIKPYRFGFDRFPFAYNGSGNSLCFDFAPAENGIKGQIIYLALGDNEPLSVLFNNFDEFLEFVTNSINSERLAVDDYDKYFYKTWRDDWTDIAAEFEPK